MKLIIVAGLAIVLWSCKGIHDGGTSSSSFWINRTSHAIKISPYSMGAIRQNLVVYLEPGDSIKIADEISMGKQGLSGFGSNYLIGSDSIIVRFDDIYFISHYVHEPTNKSEKYYLYENPRNILFIGSYQAHTIKETTNSMWNEYKYIFTEQDYLDAK